MNFFAMMFNSAAAATGVMKQAVARASGGGAAGLKRNSMTVSTAHALLIAYAMQHRAKRDIAWLSGPH